MWLKFQFEIIWILSKHFMHGVHFNFPIRISSKLMVYLRRKKLQGCEEDALGELDFYIKCQRSRSFEELMIFNKRPYCWSTWCLNLRLKSISDSNWKFSSTSISKVKITAFHFFFYFQMTLTLSPELGSRSPKGALHWNSITSSSVFHLNP